MTREQRTARLTVLIDPDKKATFEHLCMLEDLTPSQVVRRLIREFVEQRSGRPWQPGEGPESATSSRSSDSTAAGAGRKRQEKIR